MPVCSHCYTIYFSQNMYNRILTVKPSNLVLRTKRPKLALDISTWKISPLIPIRLKSSFFLQYLRMIMHTRHQPHPNRPPNRLRHLPLVHIPQSCILRMLDPSHPRAVFPYQRIILPAECTSASSSPAWKSRPQTPEPV